MQPFVLLGGPNAVDSAVLSGGTWEASYPLTRLQNRIYASVARSANATLAATQLTVTLPYPQTVGFVALIAHTLSVAAQLRVSLNGVAGAWVDAWPSGTVGEDLNRAIPLALALQDPQIGSVTTVKIEISDAGNSAGYVQIGRVMLGPWWQPAVNVEWGNTLQNVVTTPTDEALDGTLLFGSRRLRRVARFTLNWLTPAEAFSAVRGPWALERAVATDGEVLFVKNPLASAAVLPMRFVGHLRALGEYRHLAGGFIQQDFEIEEFISSFTPLSVPIDLLGCEPNPTGLHWFSDATGAFTEAAEATYLVAHAPPGAVIGLAKIAGETCGEVEWVASWNPLVAGEVGPLTAANGDELVVYGGSTASAGVLMVSATSNGVALGPIALTLTEYSGAGYAYCPPCPECPPSGEVEPPLPPTITEFPANLRGEYLCCASDPAPGGALFFGFRSTVVDGNNNKGRALIARVNGAGALQFGAAQVFAPATVGWSSAVFAAPDTVVVAYMTTTETDVIRVVVGAVSGSAVTFSAPVEVPDSGTGGAAGRTLHLAVAPDGTMILAWLQGSMTSTTVLRLNAEGTGVTLSATQSATPDNNTGASLAYDAGSGRWVLGYVQYPYGVRIRTGTLSGDTMAWATPVTIGQGSRVAVMASDARVMIAYRTDDMGGAAAFGAIESDGSLTMASAYTHSTGVMNTGLSQAVYDPVRGSAVIFTKQDAFNGVIAHVNTLVPSVSWDVIAAVPVASYFTATYHGASQRTLIFYDNYTQIKTKWVSYG